MICADFIYIERRGPSVRPLISLIFFDLLPTSPWPYDIMCV